MSGNHLVFVYGSLKTGFHNNPGFLGNPEQAELIGAAQTVDSEFIMTNATSFPYVFRWRVLPEDWRDSATPYTGAVVGEVWDVSSDVLRQLDRLEGHPRHYQRQRVMVQPRDVGAAAPPMEVWMYLAPEARGRSVVIPEAGLLNWPLPPQAAADSDMEAE